MAVSETSGVDATNAGRPRRVRRGAAGGSEQAPRTVKGASLARGPALVLGTILLAAGLYFLYKQHGFPRLANFPNGHAPVQGKVLFGVFGVNGWTGELSAVAGGLLLFGAAQHLLAKGMSLIVGVALGAAAIIAVISGDVLGLASANGWTEIGWGAIAAILLLNSMIPRRRHTITEPAGGPVAADRPVSDRRAEPVADRPAAERQDQEHAADHREEAVADESAGAPTPRS